LPGQGGAPARLVTPKLDAVKQEVERARKMIEGFKDARIELVASAEPTKLG
jgi:hypothetical protein